MDNKKLDEFIDWCKQKLAYQNKQYCSDKYKSGYEDAMKAVMSKLHSEKEHPQKEQSLTEEEIFALRAVAYGCKTNRKLVCGEFLDVVADKRMSFEDALVTVYELIERTKEGRAKEENPKDELIVELRKELDAAKNCIYKIEDALNRGSDNDYARQAIEEWAGE